MKEKQAAWLKQRKAEEAEAIKGQLVEAGAEVEVK